MLFELPKSEVLYAALCARDEAYEGRAWVGVTTTGIFCRLSCPARNPKPENCVFHTSVAACLEAGFRPCKRCKPLAKGMDADPMVATLVPALEADGGAGVRQTSLPWALIRRLCAGLSSATMG